MIDNDSNVSKEDDEWRSCSGCGKCDKHLLIFTSQLSISIMVIVFSMYQLLISQSCERDGLYSGTLTFIVGSWLPSPINSMIINKK